jgi:hypothetical protein
VQFSRSLESMTAEGAELLASLRPTKNRFAESESGSGKRRNRFPYFRILT